MTNQTHTALAARLRELHAARTRHFTSPGGAQAWSIVATDERLGDLLAAADELEAARGMESTAYQRGFADRVASTEKMQLLEDFQRECDAADEMMRMLGLDPHRCRTEGGAINIGKVREQVSNEFRERMIAAGWTPPPVHPADALAELGAPPELVEKARATCDEQVPVVTHEQVRKEVRRAINDAGDTVSQQHAAAAPLRLLCRRLGVEL